MVKTTSGGLTSNGLEYRVPLTPIKEPCKGPFHGLEGVCPGIKVSEKPLEGFEGIKGGSRGLECW